MQNLRLFEKPQRLYLNRSWSLRQRYSTLRAHYDWLCKAFSSDQIGQLYSGTGVRLATVAASASGPVELWLKYEGNFEREGELALSLRIGSGQTVVTLAFTVAPNDAGARQIFVGSIQSKKESNSLAVARMLTTTLHGLRPKPFLVAAVQTIAELAGASQVLAVSDEAHVFRGYRYFLKRHVENRHRVIASYDDLWAECGGQKREGGFYELPNSPSRRDPATIKSSKRAMYRRRYEMLDCVGQELRMKNIMWAAIASM
ncbi:MAG: VirK/YbjX family protein [Nevskia sp.]